MTFYKKLILEVTNCTPEEVELVEEIMRDENGGTLDHLSRARFTREARKAHNLSKMSLDVD